MRERGCDRDRDGSAARAALEPPRAEGLDVVKRALVGTPMPSHAMQETLLRKTLALPIFASDALSSVAYATEAALIVLVGTSSRART